MYRLWNENNVKSSKVVSLVEDGWYRWQVTIPADVLSERAADQKIGEITGIEVRRRSEGGAAETVLIEGEKGSMEIEGEYQIRKFLSAKGWPIQKNDGTIHLYQNGFYKI